MSDVSRRALASYAANQLRSGQQASQLAKSLAAVLVEQSLSDEPDLLLGDIASELEQQGELAFSRINTARSITKALEVSLKAEIKKATKTRAVLLESNIDKKVLGGVRIETPNLVWDGTIARKLRDLREAF